MAKEIEIDVSVNGLTKIKQELKDISDQISNMKSTPILDESKLNSLTSKAEELSGSLKKAENEINKTSKSTGNLTGKVLENGGAMGLLSQATGGLAMDFKDAVEASNLLSGGMGRALTAFKTFSTGAKAALISTGIGALVVAVGLLVAYWDDMKTAVNGVSSSMKKQGEIAEANVKAEESKLDTLNGQDNILKLQGKSEKEILQIKMKQTKETIIALEAQLEAQEAQKKAQVDAAKRNRDILEGILKFVSLPITAILKTVDAIGSVLGEDFGLEEKAFGTIAELVFDPESVAEEGDKTIEETRKKLNTLKNTQAGYQLDVQGINKEAAQKSIDAEKERLDELRSLRLGYEKQLEDLEATTASKKLDLEKERESKRLTLLKASKEDWIAFNRLYAKKEADIEKDKQDKLDAITDEYNSKRADIQAKTLESQLALALTKQQNDEAKKLEEIEKITEDENEKAAAKKAVQDYYDALELETKTTFNQQIKERDTTNQMEYLEQQMQFNDRLIQAELALQAAKRTSLDTGLSILTQFAGKNKAVALAILAVQKGLAVADVVAGTAKNIASIIGGTAAGNAKVIGQLGPIAAAPAVAINTAAGIKSIAATKISAATSIASILASTIQSAGSIKGGGGLSSATTPAPATATSSAPSVPSAALFGAQSTANTASAARSATPTTEQNITVRAVVSETEMTSTQNRVANIERSAEL